VYRSLSLSGSPTEVAPTRNSLNPAGVFILDNGMQLILWMGSKAPNQWGQILFGVDDVAHIDSGLLRISPPAPSGEHPAKIELWDFITKARRNRPEDFAQVIVAKEGDNTVEARFFWGLFLDPATFRGGEVSVDDLLRRVKTGGMNLPGAAPIGMMPSAHPAMAPPPSQSQQHLAPQQQQQQHGMMMPHAMAGPLSGGAMPGMPPPPRPMQQQGLLPPSMQGAPMSAPTPTQGAPVQPGGPGMMPPNSAARPPPSSQGFARPPPSQQQPPVQQQFPPQGLAPPPGGMTGQHAPGGQYPPRGPSAPSYPMPQQQPPRPMAQQQFGAR